MKILRGKSLFGLIYACLLAFPLISIVSRVIYVQSNKNAYQSYSDDMVESQVSLTSTSQLIENQTYIMNYKEYSTTEYYYIPYLTYNSINVDWSDYTTSDTTNVVAFRVRTNDNFLQLKSSDNTTINLFNVWGVTLKTITFNFKSAEYESTSQLYNLTLIGIYYKQTSLDNVFEYSIDKTISDNNFGKINFLSWFTDLFLDNNEVNNRYVHYANWYMNYILFVSCAYLLFLVLMWFINFARKLLDRGMNYDW